MFVIINQKASLLTNSDGHCDYQTTDKCLAAQAASEDNFRNLFDIKCLLDS